ncbi:hypothetical protein [Aeromicrobium sp. UC242_57]|uniref:hypothetical protein n=1 Tax=Aeromicrobium sp. UC242_57 TaxID=3374624 RepID=UPI0037A762C4
MDALAAAWDEDAALMAGGGSIPLVMALHEAVPAAEKLLLGATDSDANIHAPNERVLIDACARPRSPRPCSSPSTHDGSRTSHDDDGQQAEAHVPVPRCGHDPGVRRHRRVGCRAVHPVGPVRARTPTRPRHRSFHQVPSPLSFFDSVRELILSPINGAYGLQDSTTGFVNTEAAGHMFGSIGVIIFIFALGGFISVSFSTRSLEVAVGRLAVGVGERGWLLIVAVMLLFSLLGSTMGFSVETFGFYALLIPMFAALGYDRMVTAAVIILGALTGSMASTVNPFSIGVASGEAGVSIGDGIVLRLFLWVVLTTVSIVFVLRYARSVQRDPSRSVVGFDEDAAEQTDEPLSTELTRTQKPS